MAARDPLRELPPKMDSPYPVLRIQDHMLTVDIRGTHSIMSTHRVTFARTHQENKPATGVLQVKQADQSTNAESHPALKDNSTDHP